MLADIAPFVVGAVVVYGFRYFLDHWQSHAPAPDGLVPGEKLLWSTAAWLTVDESPASGYGYAYLTDSRLVWTPDMGNWHMRNARPGTPYTEPVILSLGEIRKVDARFRFGGSQLIVETSRIRMDLAAEGRSFGPWERYILRHAENLLPGDQPVLRSHNHYSPQEVLTVSKGSSFFIVLLLVLVGVRFLDVFVDWRGDRLSEEELIGVLVLIGTLGTAFYLWETRR